MSPLDGAETSGTPRPVTFEPSLVVGGVNGRRALWYHGVASVKLTPPLLDWLGRHQIAELQAFAVMITVQSQPAAEPVTVKTHRYPAQQILMELVNGARERMPRAATVSLESFNEEISEEFSRDHLAMRLPAVMAFFA